MRMSAWFLSSSTVASGAALRRVNLYVCVWLPATVYKIESAGI